MQGNLQEMAAADLIQHYCQSRKTMLLRIQHASHNADLYFHDGNLVHAIMDHEAGEEAIYRVLTWKEGKFNIKNNVKPPATTIERNWAGLLLEGARRIDENDQAENTFCDDENLIIEESEMNIKRLNKVVEDLKEDLGTALIATDNWNTKDAVSLVGYNSQPKAIALFNEITRNLNKSLKDTAFPGLGKYYLVHLENNYMVIVVVQDEFQEGMLADLSKTTLGMLMTVVLPKVIEGLAEAAK